MAIIYPSNIRGTTSGALAQIKRQGYTTASGGLWSLNFVNHTATTDLKSFLLKTEPTGKFMDALEQAAKNVGELQEAVMKATKAMVASAETSHKEVATASGKIRDQTDKLASAMKKFTEVAGTKQFAEAAETTKNLVDALERLARLQERGLLEKIMQAVQK